MNSKQPTNRSVRTTLKNLERTLVYYFYSTLFKTTGISIRLNDNKLLSTYHLIIRNVIIFNFITFKNIQNFIYQKHNDRKHDCRISKFTLLLVFSFRTSGLLWPILLLALLLCAGASPTENRSDCYHRRCLEGLTTFSKNTVVHRKYGD